jgi:hypothetical protein
LKNLNIVFARQDDFKSKSYQLPSLFWPRSFGMESMLGMNPTGIALKIYISIDQPK